MHYYAEYEGFRVRSPKASNLKHKASIYPTFFRVVNTVVRKH